MILIRVRIQKALETHVCTTQYGFRPAKSTSHAIYIIRRIQDYAESKGAKLNMALLDWEKAFDKILHTKLILALKRLGISNKFLKVIEDCYANPTFFVKDEYGKSETKRQSSGIRQGCPLSPYLFILVMTCIDKDINAEISNNVVNNRLPNINFDMIYYADDTILFSKSPEALNELLKLTEETSAKYGLKLNKGKCVAINMNNEDKIHSPDGKDLQKGAETMYLGNEINTKANLNIEITNKMQEVRKTWFKLSEYWKASNANTKWQLIIYDAIIRSKLLYGLETVQLTEAQQKKINAFQMRGLRQIMKKKHVLRQNTYE